MTNEWVDPAEYNTKEDFYKAYLEAYYLAKACEFLIDLVEGAGTRVEAIQKKLEEKKNYKI